jgi:hypothetical protein
MALAGLWENWRSPASEWVRSFAIVTTTPYWGMVPVEPLLDELLDLPSGNIELACDRRPDHRDVAILPGGRELHGTGLVSRRRSGEDAGDLVGGVDVQVYFRLAHRRVRRGW